jgi:hypothetical protein
MGFSLCNCVTLWLCGLVMGQHLDPGQTQPPRWPAAHTHERAGYPIQPSRWAVTAQEVDRYYRPAIVGGGALFGGDGPGRADGTFGYEYVGFGWRPGRFILGRYHDRPRQPKGGNYETEGRYHVENVFELKPLRRALHERGFEGLPRREREYGVHE